MLYLREMSGMVGQLLVLDTLPSSAFKRGSRRDKKFKEVPRADGVVSIISQMFWRKKADDTVLDRRSSRLSTFGKLSI